VGGAAPAGDATTSETCLGLESSIRELNNQIDRNFETVTGESKTGSSRYDSVVQATSELERAVQAACQGTNSTVAALRIRVVPLKVKLIDLVTVPSASPEAQVAKLFEIPATGAQVAYDGQAEGGFGGNCRFVIQVDENAGRIYVSQFKSGFVSSSATYAHGFDADDGVRSLKILESDEWHIKLQSGVESLRTLEIIKSGDEYQRKFRVTVSESNSVGVGYSSTCSFSLRSRP
jgi:hypothetical protein